MPLPLLCKPAHLVDDDAQGAVGHVHDVAAEQLVGQAVTGCRSEVLRPHVVAVGGACFGRVGELHVLAVVQLLHQARLQARQGGAAVVVLHRQICQRVDVNTSANTPRDKCSEQVGQLLALQHRVVKIADRAQPRQHRGQRRYAPQLAWALHFVDVRHLVGGDAQQAALIHHGMAFAGMLAVHPVRHPLAAPIQLDAAANLVSDRHTRPQVGIEVRNVVGLDELHLHGHFHIAVHAAHAQPCEHLTALQPSACGKRLLAVEVEHAIRVRLLHPSIPQVVEHLLAAGTLDPLEPGGDADANQRRHPLLRRGFARPVVAGGVARTVAQRLNAGSDRLVWAARGWVPPFHAAATASGVVLVAHRNGGLCCGRLFSWSCHLSTPVLRGVRKRASGAVVPYRSAVRRSSAATGRCGRL